MLKLETRRYFENSTAHAHRRWSQLFQKQAREATKVREDLERKTRALLLKAGREDLPVKPEDDFEAQERLMRRRTAESWRESARFDLREAFALQLARVDVEWEACEHRLRLDVDEKLAELGSRGRRPRRCMRTRPRNDGSPRKNRSSWSTRLQSCPQAKHQNSCRRAIATTPPKSCRPTA